MSSARPRIGLAPVKRRLLALLLIPASIVHALVVKDYDSAPNDRFSSGYPAAPIPNANPRFVGKGLDWSGIGWWQSNPDHAVALISPRHFLFAHHMAPKLGEALVFQGRDLRLHTYHIARIHPLSFGIVNGRPAYADITVGTLRETIPPADQVASYPIAASSAGISGFVGRRILLYGHPARIGVNEIVHGIMPPDAGCQFTFMSDGLSTGMARPEVGDSGSPSFIVIGGRLALVGTHWTFDTDSMASGLIGVIRDVLGSEGQKPEVALLPRD